MCEIKLLIFRNSNLLFTKDGEVFDFDRVSNIAIGGSYSVDKNIEEWLDHIEGMLDYGRWYCGHYHIDKTIDKVRFFLKNFVTERM